MSKYRDLLISKENLSWAWRKVQRLYQSADAPCDVAELAAFELDLERQMQSIARDLGSGRYKLAPLVLLPQPKKPDKNGQPRMRQSFYVSVRDQVAWIAVVNVIGPTLDSKMPLWSYGHRLYKTAWYEKRDGRSHLELGPYRHSGGSLYRRFKHSWPLFRRHISLTARIMVHGLGNPELLDPSEKSARNFPERPSYLDQRHWPTNNGTTLYYGSIDLEKFYPRVSIPSIIRSFESYLDNYTEDAWLQLLMTSMLSFRIARERSVLLDDEIVEPLTSPGPFRGIPTNLMVAGFLSNVALLPLDTLVEQWLQKNNRIAHFRFVDDHVVIAYDFEELCTWIGGYRAALKAFDIGPEISESKYDPPDLVKVVNQTATDIEKAEIKEQAKVDGQNPSKLMTKTLALVSEIAGSGFDILAEQSREMKLNELEWLLLANIPDREIRSDTRAAFAAGQIARLVPLLFTPSTEILEKSREVAGLKADVKSDQAALKLSEQELSRFSKKEFNRYRNQADHYFKLLFQAFRDHLDKTRLMVRVLDYCRVTGQSGTFSVLRYIREQYKTSQPLVDYLVPLAIQTIARHIVTATFDMNDSKLLARERFAARRYLEALSRLRVRTLLRECISVQKQDVAAVGAKHMLIVAVSYSVAVLQHDAIKRRMLALAADIDAPDLLSTSQTWLARTGSPVGVWAHWLDGLLRVDTFDPGQVWRLTASMHDPNNKIDWENLRKGPLLFPANASEFLFDHVDKLKGSDGGWLLDQQKSQNPIRLNQVSGKSRAVDQLQSHLSELDRKSNFLSLNQWVVFLKTLSPYDPRAGEWSALEIVRQLLLTVQRFEGNGLKELDALHPTNILIPRVWTAAEPPFKGMQRQWTWEAWRQVTAEGKVVVAKKKIEDYRRHPTEAETSSPEQLWRTRLRGVGLLLFGLCRRDFSLPATWNVRGLERDVGGYIKSQLEETAVSSRTQAIIEAAILPRSFETALMARNLWAFFGSRPVTSINDTTTDPPNIVDEQGLYEQINRSQDVLSSNQISVLNHAARQLIPMNAVQLTNAAIEPIIVDDEV